MWPEFKVEAIRLAESVGVNEAAKRLGIPQSSIGNWQLATGNWQLAAAHSPRGDGGTYQAEGVGHERVRQSLHRQGLHPVYKRPYRVTTDSAHKKPIAPNLLERRFSGWAGLASHGIGVRDQLLPTCPRHGPKLTYPATGLNHIGCENGSPLMHNKRRLWFGNGSQMPWLGYAILLA
jgi:hypothetical protein